MGIFDQSQKDPADAHTLSIREEDYPEKFQGVIRRLIKAISEPDVRETMDVEDDYLEDLEDMERMIAKKDAALVEKDAALVEKDAALVEKDAALVEKDAALEQAQLALKQQETMLETAINFLVANGLSEQEARAKLIGSGESPS